VLTWLTLSVILFELWYAVAYLYAYRQTREQLIWLQVGQAAALIALLIYIAATIARQSELNLLTVIALLVVALAMNMLWRQGLRRTSLALSYPRGIVDILSFRRPAADLKRRVRSK
jgi:uncharacterized membrane protein